ncbi:ABC transporter ATP-binding protein/permease [Rummeliibacillus sp. G93]|uniref:ATP-binding cassette domain-containing protein n=1 Tax=Rummeliibacillus sp. G93 TaxID=2939494 RepID=UPI00201BBEF6|nr:ABC transporter ATP-binding protein [Rummeliibacillus sp. G93]UQW97657.1 ABC transporter ATP-binding protein/permease [Rummeliibacillus sp. G93]
MKLIIKHGSAKYAIFVLLGLVVMSIEGFLLPETIRRVIKGLENRSMEELAYGVGFGIVGFLVLGLGGYFYQYSTAKLMKNFNTSVKLIIYEHHVYKYQKSSKSRSSDVLSFLQNDLKLLESNYISATINAFQTIVLVIVASGYILLIHFWLGIIFIIFALITMIFPKLNQKKIEKSAADWSKANEDYTNELTENIKGVETIIGYQREQTFFERLKANITNSESKNVKMTMAQAGANLTAYVASHILSLIPVFIGGFFVFNGSLEVNALIAVYIASDRIANPLAVTAGCINRISTTKGIRKKLTMLERENSAFKQNDNHSLTSILPLKIQNGRIQFENNLILDGFNLEILPGSKLLLLGESGSGKTTIINIIQQVLPLTDGQITYGGKIEHSARAINRNISYIRQTPMIFNDTLEFNLTLGEDFKHEELNRAVKAAGLSSVVEEKGLDFVLGESGKHLSGGQNQRVEIARAILRERELLIADEVTAALDKDTAEGIHNTLFNLPQAIIEISHHVNEDDLVKYNYVYQIGNKKLHSKRITVK